MRLTQRPPSISVGELTRRIKGTLEERFRTVWVEGEMGKVTEHRSGHIYFTLKDNEARIDGVVWRTTAWRIGQQGGYQPTEGHRVLARGQLSVHAPRGAYSLIVDVFLPAGVGDLQAAYEQLKRKLAAEGLFDAARKKPLPFLPRAVGVITSATGAARHDIETVLRRRAPQVHIVLYPAQVQGEGAAADVARGIAELDWDPRVEVIIVGRGGGSLEDLWAFNEEDVARAIAACHTPVISAVGHESDTTIADLVADVRAATPSEAAEKAVPNRDDLLYTLDGLVERLGRAVERRVEQARFRLVALERRARVDLGFEGRAARLDRWVARLERAAKQQLAWQRRALHQLEVTLREQHPGRRLSVSRQRVEAARSRLDRAMARRLDAEAGRLRRLDGALRGVDPARRVAQGRRRLDQLVARLDQAGAAAVGAARLRLQLLMAQLGALSPLAGLERGFSVTRVGERVVRDAASVAVGEAVEILLHRGRLRAQVTESIAEAAIESREE